MLLSNAPPAKAPVHSYKCALLVLEDKLLLKVFRYLNESANVLSTAQVCCTVFARVDALFNANKYTIQPNAGGSSSTSNATVNGAQRSNAAGAAQSGVTANLQTVTAQIASKLAPNEMKVIVQMTEHVHKVERDYANLSDTNEDLEHRLTATQEAKDILAEKLQSNELVCVCVLFVCVCVSSVATCVGVGITVRYAWMHSVYPRGRP